MSNMISCRSKGGIACFACKLMCCQTQSDKAMSQSEHIETRHTFQSHILYCNSSKSFAFCHQWTNYVAWQYILQKNRASHFLVKWYNASDNCILFRSNQFINDNTYPDLQGHQLSNLLHKIDHDVSYTAELSVLLITYKGSSTNMFIKGRWKGKETLWTSFKKKC